MTEPMEPSPTETGTDAGTPEDQRTDPPIPGARLPRGEAIGRYLVLEPIGEGGMGVVYAAYDPELDRKVALKLVRTDGRSSSHRSTRMLREAQALARLAHPNVVAIHDVGVLDDGQVYLAMELVEGQTLGEWARGRRWTEIVEAFVQAGEGLLAAHRAGLVHRDFKPGNCVVDGHGRVRVLDFGLSRPSQALEERVPEAALRLADGHTPLSAAVTMAGVAVGTPAYMPPEQFRGEPPDARSDQFSFCVSLWELLFGQRPYEGGDARTGDRELRRPSGASRVPGRLVAALRRGLEPKPEVRFPEMELLLVELRAVGRRRRGPLVVLLGLGFGLIGAVAWMSASRPAPADPCEGGRALVEPIWAAQRDAVHEAFVATSHPTAEDTFERVDASLTGYLDDWSAAHRDACEATMVHGSQSERMLDARMACLEDRRVRAMTTVEVLATVDAKLLRRAASLAGGLPGLERCADTQALARVVPPPEDPAVAAEVRGLEQELAELGTRLNAGRVDEVTERLDVVRARAEATGHAPVVAYAAQLRAGVDLLAGRFAEARDELRIAVVLAARSHDPSLLAEVWLDLLQAETRGGDFERARSWLLAADAAAAAEGVGPSLPARVDLAAAQLLEDSGDLQGAQARVERAIAGFELEAPEHFAHARALSTLGGILDARGRHAEAEPYHRRAIERLEDLYGSIHPLVAAAHVNLGLSLSDSGAPEQALAEYERGAEILSITLGADHPYLATVRNNQGLALLQVGRFEDAVPPLEQAIAAWTAAHGADDHRVAMATDNLATAHFQLGHLEQALAMQLRVVELLQAKHGGAHPSTAIALDNLGQTELRLGRAQDALEHHTAALAMRREVFPDDPAKHARALAAMGLALLELGRAAEALEPLEQAAAVVSEDDPSVRSMTLWSLAKALHANGGDRARTRELAQQAIAALPAGQAGEIAEIRAWLAGVDDAGAG